MEKPSKGGEPSGVAWWAGRRNPRRTTILTKERAMLKKMWLPGFLLASALSFLAAPSSQVSASECGGPGGAICKENTACLNIIFYSHCTKTSDYWNDI